MGADVHVIWWGVVLGVVVLVGNSRAERCFPVGNCKSEIDRYVLSFVRPQNMQK